MSNATPKLTFRRMANHSYSTCGLYRVRELRPGLFISERTWLPREKPQHLYATAWCFVGFSDTEDKAKRVCQQAEKQLQANPPQFQRSTQPKTGPKAQHSLLDTYRGK